LKTFQFCNFSKIDSNMQIQIKALNGRLLN
jgi:hypothetical protein